MKIPKHIKVKKLWVENYEIKGTIVVAKWWLSYITAILVIKECKFKLCKYPKYIKRALKLVFEQSKEQDI